MAEEPIYKTSYLGSKVTVYQNRVVWKKLIQQITIPIDRIASIDTKIPLYAGVVIETTGGKKYKIPVQPFAKSKLEEAIYQAQSSNAQGTETKSSNLDDLEKLAELKDKGIVTQEEFDIKKKELLDIKTTK